MTALLASFVAAFLLGLVLVPVCRGAARRGSSAFSRDILFRG